ncbi:MAG TPA: DUF4442 domain-containing protein [Solimonas sp.]|nr:DUF4442 domain-containing protein [Solimonas sp.]
MTKPSPLQRAVSLLDRAPAVLRGRLVTALFTSQVKFAGTGGVHFVELSSERAVLEMKNRRRVRNHIGGVHAAAMALLAETATGAVFGMNLPAGKLPLLKSMQIDYVRRASGGLRAEATISDAQRAEMALDERGNTTVSVRVTDEAGEEPVHCQLVWAWVSQRASAMP